MLTGARGALQPGKVLDLAAGSARHSLWLAERGWNATAVDIVVENVPGVRYIRADLEYHEYHIAPGAWDLILCWLYWQPDLLTEIAQGVHPGGVVALAGKTTGRFATSLAQYREAFPNWPEIASGQNDVRTFFIARRP